MTTQYDSNIYFKFPNFFIRNLKTNVYYNKPNTFNFVFSLLIKNVDIKYSSHDVFLE
jgi:hypothetical protein